VLECLLYPWAYGLLCSLNGLPWAGVWGGPAPAYYILLQTQMQIVWTVLPSRHFPPSLYRSSTASGSGRHRRKSLSVASTVRRRQDPPAAGRLHLCADAAKPPTVILVCTLAPLVVILVFTSMPPSRQSSSHPTHSPHYRLGPSSVPSRLGSFRSIVGLLGCASTILALDAPWPPTYSSDTLVNDLYPAALAADAGFDPAALAATLDTIQAAACQHATDAEALGRPELSTVAFHSRRPHHHRHRSFCHPQLAVDGQRRPLVAPQFLLPLLF
jgi:hypothetical protein